MIGEVLRAEREKQNLTIKDIEKGTSIRALYIDAIEKGNYEQLPGEVYAKGFIRNYAHFLKLNANDIMQQYMAEQHPDQVQAQDKRAEKSAPVQKQPEVKKEEPKQEVKKVAAEVKKVEKEVATEVKKEAAEVKTEVKAEAKKAESAVKPQRKAPTRTERRTHEVHKPYTNSSKHTDHTSSRKKIFAILAVIIVLIAAAAYAFSGSDEKPAAQAPQQTQQQAAQPAPQPQKVDGVQVEATFSEDCWTQVTVDGKEVYEGTETKGKTESWQGKQSVAIRVGNAGAVTVKVNGQDLGKVGGEGQVVNKMYTQNGDQSAQPQQAQQAQAQQPAQPQQQAQPAAQQNQQNQQGKKNN